METATLRPRSIGMAVIAIAGLPAAWNIVARNEYRHQTIERCVGSKKVGAYLLAAAIFGASFLRDVAFKRAMDDNPSAVLPILCPCVADGSTGAVATALTVAGGALMASGTLLVVTSFARLGVTGTYLGDYFGIKMKEPVTAFPFNRFENPMYLGSTLNFLGAAVAQNSGVGLALTGVVALVYHVATTYYENPFTAKIYADSDKE